MTTPTHDPHPGYRRPDGPHDLYTTKPAWDIDRPQPAFDALARQGAWRGRVLDIGCGTGEHTLLAAAHGLAATGIDQSAQAVTTAEHKARARGLDARFIQHDAFALPALGETFDTIVDCGLFHIFGPDTRTAYAASLASVLATGGKYFMLGFSDRQPGEWGPHRLSRTDIESTFTTEWHIESIEPTSLVINPAPGYVEAWLATLTRS